MSGLWMLPAVLLGVVLTMFVGAVVEEINNNNKREKYLEDEKDIH